MSESIVKYWPIDTDIPDGWEMADDFTECHHGRHAVLIRYLNGENHTNNGAKDE